MTLEGTVEVASGVLNIRSSFSGKGVVILREGARIRKDGNSGVFNIGLR